MTTDLETRVRRGLAGEPARRSTHDLLDGVRRDARRRRTRRTTLVAAAAASVLVAGGGVVWHHREIQPAAQGPGSAPTGTTAVSVTGTGELFKVVASQGCTIPCSTIWKRVGGHWSKLATLRSAGAPDTLVIRSIVMAPDGRNGWAWGDDASYVTHDGGRSWTQMTTGPAAAPDSVYAVEAGQTQVWVSSSRSTGGSDLWRAAVGSDDWTRVQPPDVTMSPGATPVPPKHFTIDTVLPDGRLVLNLGPYPHGIYYTVGNEYGWTRQPQHCAPIPSLFGGRVQEHKVCGPIARDMGRSGTIIPLHYSSIEVAVRPGTASAPVGDDEVLFATRDRAVIATHAGLVPSDLHLGRDYRVETGSSSESGAHVAFLTGGHRIFLSNDNGRHWTQVD